LLLEKLFLSGKAPLGAVRALMKKEGHLQNHVFYAARDEDDVQHLDSESTSRETGVEDAQRVGDPISIGNTMQPMEQREKSRTCSSFPESRQRKAKPTGRRPTQLGAVERYGKCVKDELPFANGLIM